MTYMFSGYTLTLVSGLYYIDCAQANVDTMPTIYFLMANKWFGIHPSTYLFNLGGACVIGFAQSSSDSWLVGAVFLRNYYSVWDDDSGLLTFAPRTNGAITTIPDGTVPAAAWSDAIASDTASADFINSEGFAVLMAFVGLLGATGIGFAVTYIVHIVMKEEFDAKIYARNEETKHAEWSNNEPRFPLTELTLDDQPPLLILQT